MNVYAASCNPPRRAKRLRSSSPDGDDDDVHLPKRRGRRPGSLSRAAREAQRKINHSLIEKARRTKINEALATLRELVPPEYKRPSPDDDDDGDDDDLDPKRRPKPRPSGEKEFKLEILVRTVAYLQDLTAQLEHNRCPRCCEPIRHRDSLPSISTWLPSAEDHPSLLTPSQSPPVVARAAQLPTPPASTTCPPTTNAPVPPVLTLPSPSTLLPPTHFQPRFSGFTPRANARSSPVHTPDDETAASLLLRIGTSYALTPSRLLGLSADR